MSTHLGTNRPPRKWRPSNLAEPNLGAVRLTKTSGQIDSTLSFPSGPASTSHPEGMSTLTMGVLFVLLLPSLNEAKRESTPSNGGRTGGLKENPKIASSITSVFPSTSLNGARESGPVGMSMKGICMLSHCTVNRYREVSHT